MNALPKNTLRQIDRMASEHLGIQGITLMDNAGSAATDEAKKLLADFELARVGVLCGGGNNAGDGFVLARKLFSPALDLKVFSLAPLSSFRSDTKHHLDLLRTQPILLEKIDSPEPLRRFAAAGPLLWVDAIFGTGLARPVEGIARHCIEFLNDSGAPILAIDIPSGLDADTGEILGAAIHAHTTVTFVAPKLGFARQQGPQCTGRVVVDRIGIPEESIRVWSLS